MNKEYLDYDGLQHYHTNVAVMINDVDAKLEAAKVSLQNSLDRKANSSHTHSISEVTSLQSSLDGKSDTGHMHTRSQITDFPSSLPASDVYSWAKSSSKPSYSISEISGLQSTLDEMNSLLKELHSNSLKLNWRKLAVAGSNTIAYGNGRYVSGSTTEQLINYSFDGIEWMGGSYSALPGVPSIVRYLNGKFIIGDASGNLAYCENGIDWISISQDIFNNKIHGLAYGNGKFVAVSENNKMAYSTDGITWTKVSSSPFKWGTITQTPLTITSVVYGNGKFVAVGGKGIIAYSTDGITWTKATKVLSDIAVHCIAYNDGKFFIGNENNQMAYSTDGVTWTKMSSPFNTSNATIYAISYTDGILLVSTNKLSMCSFDDGNTWFSIPITGYDILYVNGQFFLSRESDGLYYNRYMKSS